MDDSLYSDLDKFSVSESIVCDVDGCKQYLSSGRNPLTILTQNIRSIFKNFDNLSVFQQRLNINCDVVVLTECWLGKHSKLPNMPGYNIYSSKINYNQNDGVVVYIRNNLNVTVEEPPNLIDCNRLLIKIGSDFAILALYRPPSFRNINIFIDSIDETLRQLSSFKNLILIGDININILPGSSDPAAQDYLNLCSFHGLLPAHTFPTHQSGSCLDHIMLKSSYPSLALVTNSTVTDHRAALLTLFQKLPHKNRTQIVSKINVNKLEEDLCNIDFDLVYNSADADTCMSHFIQNVQQAILRNTINIRVSNKNYNIKPWITPGLIRCMRHRDKLHIKAKSKPDNLILQSSYKRYRNFCNDLLKKVKTSYDKNELEKAGTNSKLVWECIKKVTYTAKQHESPSGLLQACSSQLASTNSANEFFVNIGKKLAEKVKRNSSSFPSNTSTLTNTLNSFVLLDTDEEEVYSIIMSLKNDSAAGWDRISNKILKEFKHILVPPLTYIYQKCLSDGIFPKCLKKSVVVPVHKSGSKDQITNYRPISILPSTSKILEKIINKRLVQYLEKHSILSKTQYGFRSKLSTADAVHQLTDYVVQELDKGNQTIGIFLDLAKAFDTVSIPILLHKLEALGIRGNQLKLFANYLDERTQCVKIGNVISSDLKNTSFGVPQGSVLGPTLFLVYINDLCDLKLDGGKIISYADDTALLFSAKSAEAVYKYAQQGFNIVNTWLQHHLLTLNPDKTNYIKFSMRKSNLAPTNLKLYAHICKDPNDDPCICPGIAITNKVKYLGIIIDETLSFRYHIEALCSRVRKLIFVFKKIRSIANSNLIKQVYVALCQSVLTYCITSWGGLAKTTLLTIERAQRAVLKVSTFRPFLFSTDLLYKSCKVLTVRQLFIMSTVLKQHASLSYSTEYTNKRRKDIVCPQIIKTKHAFSSRFFVFLGPFLYNRLNAMLDLYPLNYVKCKKTLQEALENMSYEDTEKLLIILK